MAMSDIRITGVCDIGVIENRRANIDEIQSNGASNPATESIKSPAIQHSIAAIAPVTISGTTTIGK
jgi:hypothetical protein